ncbi:hypothetical protein VIGAN_08184400 [Vigna angularis var. angularis]|uniref:Uncharacterized protein n=1 Tax=Vigna angularis var. angularis TaxID=157739 RepID=A0A0S3SQQ7_PHAAN|nr:hypothetical protein VIGAN_08184400 [Vigna angularis var. angularis]
MRKSSIGKKSTGEAIGDKLINCILKLNIVLKFVVNLTRNSSISSNSGVFFSSSEINGNFNPKLISQTSPKFESVRITHNPQTWRQTYHHHASTHVRRRPEMGSPSLHQHLPHLNHNIMVPFSHPFDSSFEPLHEINNRRNHQLRTVVPVPGPRTLHR